MLHTEQRLAQVRASVVTNLIAIYKALGGGWEPGNPGRSCRKPTSEEMASRTKWGKLLDADAISPSDRALLAPAPFSPRVRSDH